MISTQLASATPRRRSIFGTGSDSIARLGAKALPFIAVAFGAALAFNADAQTNLKIGVVNVGKLLDASPQAVAVGDKLKTEFASRQSEILKMGQDLQAKNDRFQKDQAVMGEEERVNLQRQIRDGQRDLQRTQDQYVEDLNARRTEESNKLLSDIAARIRTYASAQNYDLVLSDAVYVSGQLDITAEVLKALQADAGKPGATRPGGAAPAPARPSGAAPAPPR
ncbi:MAG TPA: OmpH family outer membrane protein [Gammaproteobacteria bacterium]|nr:OmpH family outer membrane protein [Gammaproteobacteria bacterium]